MSDLLSVSSGLLPSPLSSWVLVAILLGVSLSLIFFGRRVIKAMIFLLGGLAGAYIVAIIGAQYLSTTSFILAELAGFVIGGLFGLLLLPLGIGLALGVFGYALTENLLSNPLAAIAAGATLFVVGIVLSGWILAMISVLLGSLVLFSVATYMGVSPPLAVLSVAAIAVAGLWVQNNPRLKGQPSTPLPPEAPKTRKRSITIAAIGIAAVIVIATMFAYVPSLSQSIRSNSLLGLLPSLFPGGSNSTSPTNDLSFNVYSPTIIGGNANITFPASYDRIANYTLGLINRDRAGFGLGQVTLSPVKSGQQHADSMLYFGYFSHFDNQGYKPYMRYTLLGGTGAVEENVAYESWSGPHYFRVTDVERTISVLESQMIYNDSQCCNNGHRMNILNPMHTRVSIGIAFDSTRAYFVEDFENYYADVKFTVTGQNYIVSISGAPLRALQPTEIAVFYDSPPVPQTAAQLNGGPHEYDPGTLTGGVLPQCSFSCPYFPSGVTVYANTWQYNPTQVEFIFSMKSFIQKYGAGVYTIYLMSGTSTTSATTSISLFVGS
jgi:uncharacterized protein YkwD